MINIYKKRCRKLAKIEREHQEFLKDRGITEEEYQKRIKRYDDYEKDLIEKILLVYKGEEWETKNEIEHSSGERLEFNGLN